MGLGGSDWRHDIGDAVMRARQPSRAVNPTTRWGWTTWLSGSSQGVNSPAVRAELVACMFSRMTSLVQSAIITVMLTAVAAFHHPTPAFKLWLTLDAVLVTARLLLVVAIQRFGRGVPSKLPIADLFILAGTVWCLVLGFGAGLCIDSGDAGLGTLGAFLAMGTVGGLVARNPGTPRLTILHMSLIIVPLAGCAAVSSAPLVGWMVLLAPCYLIGMVSINGKLHDDYVELILGRIENRQLALHCPLTRLPNRTLFNQRLARTVEAAQKTGEEAFLLCLDLDGFKQVNDEHGHPKGDLILVEVASRLSALIGPDDTAARLGGDEFAIIVSTNDRAGAEAIATAIIASLSKPFLIENRDIQIGVSIGLAAAHRNTRDPSELLAQSDLALYAAKKAGKGVFCWFDLATRPPARFAEAAHANATAAREARAA